MHNQLEKAKINNNIIAIYTDIFNTNNFSVGYVVSFSGKYILFLHVGTHGDFDGYSVINIDDIYRIETKSKYLNKIKILCNFKVHDIFNVVQTDNLILDLLRTCNERNSIALVIIGENSNVLVGYVERIEGDMIYMLQVNDYGEEEGHTIFSYKEILRVSIEDIECREIDILYKTKGDVHF